MRKGRHMINTEVLREITEFINSVGMTASLVERNEEIVLDTLLAGIPGEAEEGHMVVGNPLELEMDGSFTEYFRLYYEIPMDVADIKTEYLYKVMNIMNGVVPIGYFVYDTGNEERKRVSIRHTITCDTEERLSAGMVCECIQLILEYGAVMEEILAGLLSGMELRQILEAEGLKEV